MSSPAPLGMFIIGFIIFALYLWGLLTMIYRSHRQQRRELENDPELRAYYRKLRDEDDYVDYDGHGNWGRFNPHADEKEDSYVKNLFRKKKRKTKGKKNVGKSTYWD